MKKVVVAKKRRKRWSGDAWNDENLDELPAPVKEKKKRILRTDTMLEYLRAKKLFVRKDTIRKETGLSRLGVDRALRILRKEKKVVMYKRKYWGLAFKENQMNEVDKDGS